MCEFVYNFLGIEHARLKTYGAVVARECVCVCALPTKALFECVNNNNSIYLHLGTISNRIRRRLSPNVLLDLNYRKVDWDSPGV